MIIEVPINELSNQTDKLIDLKQSLDGIAYDNELLAAAIMSALIITYKNAYRQGVKSLNKNQKTQNPGLIDT